MADGMSDYYIAVDGKNGAVSPYKLALHRGSMCGGPSCFNFNDNLSCTLLEDTRSSGAPNISTDSSTAGPAI